LNPEGWAVDSLELVVGVGGESLLDWRAKGAGKSERVETAKKTTRETKRDEPREKRMMLIIQEICEVQ